MRGVGKLKWNHLGWRPLTGPLVLLALLAPGASAEAQADLSIKDISSAPMIFSGRDTDVNFTIVNLGTAINPNSFEWRVYLSDNRVITLNDIELARGNLPSGSNVPGNPQTISVSVPAGLNPGEYYIGVVVDANSIIAEPNEVNNARHGPPIRLLLPAPDLTAAEVRSQAVGAAGETLPVTFTMENRGNEPATFDYGVYLSNNAIISVQDQLLFRGQRNLAAGSFQTRSDYVHLSATLPSGDYYLGLVLDPDEVVDELDETNNWQATAGPLHLETPDLQLLTAFVPEAIVGVPFAWRFAAAGGTGSYTFSVVDGALPDGLSLDGQTGDLQGTPTTAGLMRFVLQISCDGQRASTGYTLLVSEPTVSLSVQTRALPPAVLQSPYSTQLAALGGVAPYSWSVVSGALPSGLALADEGLLSGAPSLVGSFDLEVELQDARGEVARSSLTLTVVDQGLLTITTGFLPVGQVGNAYIAGFDVVGGSPPVQWTLVGGDLPPGIALDSVGGILSGAPLAAGRFRFQVQATDQGGLFDTNNYVIEVLAQPLAIVTSDLDLAAVEVAYSQKLNVLPSSGEAPFSWRLRSGILPQGVTLDPTGLLEGTPSAGTAGLYNLLLEVDDSRGAFGRRAYVLEVQDEALAGRLRVQPEAKGCSSVAGGGSILASLALLVLLLLGKGAFAGGRRRGIRSKALRLCCYGALILASLSPPAQSRAGTGSYSVSISPQAYSGLVGGTPVTFSSTDESVTSVALPFPVTFFGVEYTDIVISTNGFVQMGTVGSSHYSNHAIPDASAPNGMVALWWDDLKAYTGSSVVTKVEGSAPNRAFVVEYSEWGRYGGPIRLNMQLRLFETTNVIRINYGAISGTGSMTASAGIESPSGQDGLRGLLCTPTCGTSNWPTNQGIVFSREPDIATIAASAPTTVFGSVAAQVDADVANLGGRAAGAFVVGAILSLDPVLDAADPILSGQGPVAGLATGETKHISFLAQLPGTLVSNQSYYLFVVANITGSVAEAGTTNNSFGPLELRSGPPTANLRAFPPTMDLSSVAPGGKLQVTLRIENTGNLPAQTDFSVVLSGNSVISQEDLAVSNGSLNLAAGAVDQRTVLVTLPGDLREGVYTLGILADAAQALDEPDESDNVAGSASPIAVVSSTLQVLTQSLIPGRVGRAYDLILQAAGGNGSFVWSVAGGNLPPGISLDSSGRLSGSPTAAGDYDVRFLAKSGAMAALAPFTLSVVDTELPLTVVTAALPDGIFGSEYSASLVAVGGSAPLSWNLASGELPPGMGILPEGILGGLSGSEGEFSFQVQVSDAAGATALRSLSLHIAQPGNLVVVTVQLPRARLSESYSHSLMAAGGLPPYKWSLDGSGRLPEGLTLSTEGVLSGTPTEVGVFDIIVKVRDDRARFDTNTLSLTVGADQGISILTGLLPVGTYELAYDATLVASGGQAPYTWRLLGGKLPSGLSMSDAGEITGTPLGDGQELSSTFIVEAADAAGRRDLAGLSIRVAKGPITQPRGGCSSAPGAGGAAFPLLLVLLGILGGVALSRRRSPKGAGLLDRVALLGALVGFSLFSLGASGCGGKKGCKGVRCGAGTVCAEADGLCHCGGASGEACAEGESCDPLAGVCAAHSALCDAVSCGAGEACDPTDGGCKCGGAGGETCASGKICESVTGSCIQPSVCGQVVCAPGERCDASTGLCRCGDSACGVGERCESGACATDPCFGVSCSGGNLCDPADGVCKCGGAGGPSCANGETCDPDGARCVPSASCVSINCTPGTACDPADGLCKCGGLGGQLCTASQSCELSTYQCVGGDPCVNVSCSGGTSCDPEDGLCRCGGRGGPTCAQSERCLFLAGLDPFCSVACSAAFPNCASEDGCYYSDTLDQTFCRGAGNSVADGFCAVSTDCEAGLHCRRAGTGAGTCVPYCDTGAAFPQDGSCGTGYFCDPIFSAQPSLGVCKGV